ncbi:hypothetical protein D3C78_1413540 [compost metagenome]
MKATIQPTLPMSPKAQPKASNAGATPKATMSDSESYSAPKALWVLVMRATRPSRPSSTIATKIAMAANAKYLLALTESPALRAAWALIELMME